MENSNPHRRARPRLDLRAFLWASAILAAIAPCRAEEEKRWTLTFQPMLMDAYGHDQHVLTVHQVDLDSTPRTDSKTAVDLETDDGPAYRGTVEYRRVRWGWGLDFLWWNGSQDAADRSAAADGGGGPIEQIAFEVADRTFLSSGPDQVLFYGILEDTDITAWTLDVYAIRSLTEMPQTNVHLLLGLRNADFDNDYRAVVGIDGMAGSRLDASSNYGRMMGPLVGLTASGHVGRNTLRGYLGQSVVLGEAELSSSSREFTGPFIEAPSFFTEESFRERRDVAIPISELRLNWSYDLGERWSFGVAAETSAWWDVQVPPGVIPIAGGDQALHENTLVFFGLAGTVSFAF
jgi:hypothetical protein